jgi:hypothetical protein
MADSTWMIDEGESRDEQIEAAVNTILGMSLVHDVMLALASPGSTPDKASDCWRVTVDASNGDTGVIACASEQEAIQTLNAVFAGVQDTLRDMPPFGRRRSISKRHHV